MTKTYNERRKEYEKNRETREPRSRRSIVQIVTGFLKMKDLENVDVPTRDVFSLSRRRVYRTYEDIQ